MGLLLIVIAALLVVALYPVVRDVLRQRRRAAPAYVEGLQLLLDGQRQAALARLKEAVEIDTANVDAYIRLGDIFRQLGEIDRAIKVHENLTLRRNLSPNDERKVFRALVRDYLKTDRKVKVITILEELVRTDRSDLSSYEELLGLYVETGSWDKCAELLKTVDRGGGRAPRVAALFAEFGRAYGKVNPQAGLEALETALKLDRNSVAARLYLGDLQLAQGKAAQAVETWEELLNMRPDKNYLVRDRLERAYYELGRYEDVAQVFERLLRKVPNDAGLAVALAQLYNKKEAVNDAIRLLERFVRGAAPSVAAQVSLASMYLSRGDVGRSRSLLEAVVNRLHETENRCRVCGQPLEESILRCSACRSWQTAAG